MTPPDHCTAYCPTLLGKGIEEQLVLKDAEIAALKELLKDMAENTSAKVARIHSTLASEPSWREIND
jgi:hypothetical protein